MKYLFVTCLFLLFCSIIYAQDAALVVDEQTICTAIEDRVPSGVDSSFSSDVGKLYCYTKISGSDDTTTVSHVWYLGDEEKAKIELSVKGKTWRTWSSKNIDPSWIGNWKVEVVSANGDVLATKSFVITAPAE
jgi:hypothetical protein